MTSKTSLRLRCLGFCGVDDSVAPELLSLISQQHPWVEWGVLFRPGLEGDPRYPTTHWLERLAALAKGSNGEGGGGEGAGAEPTMRLAAHLCGERVNELLRGDKTFILSLYNMGFRRAQINATKANGVDTSLVNSRYAAHLADCADACRGMEIILQFNAETEGMIDATLEELLLRRRRGAEEEDADGGAAAAAKGDNQDIAAGVNVSVLFDASMGKGTRLDSSAVPRPSRAKGFRVGYAGGISAGNIQEVLGELAGAVGQEAAGLPALWVDMESSLRMNTKAGYCPSFGVKEGKGQGEGGRGGEQGAVMRDCFSVGSAYICALQCLESKDAVIVGRR